MPASSTVAFELEGKRHAAASLARRYAKAAFYTGTGNLVSRAFTALVPVILARCLAPRDFGEYSLVLSAVLATAMVSGLGQNSALQKFLPEYAVTNPARGAAVLVNTFALLLPIFACLSVALFVGSNWVAATVYRDTSLTRSFRFCALLLATVAVFNLCCSAALGLEAVPAYRRALVIRGVTLLGASWVGAVSWALTGAFLAQLIASVVGTLVLIKGLVPSALERFGGAPRMRLDAGVLREVGAFGIPAFLSSMTISPAYWWANTVVAREAGLEHVALTSIGFIFAQLILLVPSSVSQPAISYLSEANVTLGRHEFDQLASTNVRLVWALTLPACFSAATLGPLVVSSLFGTKYQLASHLVVHFSVGTLFLVLSQAMLATLTGMGKIWWSLMLNLVWLAVFAALTLLLVPISGGFGLSLSYLLSWTAAAFVIWGFSRAGMAVRYLGLRNIALLSLLGLAVVAVCEKSGSPLTKIILSLMSTIAIIVVELKLILTQRERSELGGALARFGLRSRAAR